MATAIRVPSEKELTDIIAAVKKAGYSVYQTRSTDGFLDLIAFEARHEKWPQGIWLRFGPEAWKPPHFAQVARGEAQVLATLEKVTRFFYGQRPQPPASQEAPHEPDD